MRYRVVIKIKADNLENKLRARTSKIVNLRIPHLDQVGMVHNFVVKLFFGTCNGFLRNGKGLNIHLMYSNNSSCHITPMTFLHALKHVNTIPTIPKSLNVVIVLDFWDVSKNLHLFGPKAPRSTLHHE